MTGGPVSRVGAFHGYFTHPILIVEDDSICGDEVEAHTPCTCAQKEQSWWVLLALRRVLEEGDLF